VLRVEGLGIAFPERGTGPRRQVVRDLSFELGGGEMVGLVGESGCGKTLTALALLRLLPPRARITSGRVLLDGEDLLRLDEAALRRVRGGRIGMVFQEPASALNPVLSIGFQVAEAVRAHSALDRAAARRRAVELLERVALADAARRLGDYPHELSGGQQQRVVLAMALAAEPTVLLADEPTTALDVTVQAQILDLLAELRRDLGLTVLLVTHDLAVVSETCDRVLVMYAGELVEEAATADLFAVPAHPYTAALLATLPRLGGQRERGRLPTIRGRVPDPAHLPSGCPFHPRCDRAFDPCTERHPPLFDLATAPGDRRRARCWLHDEAEARREDAYEGAPA
jgi:oligopeptide/dipeptide ABC transporter ATP-binding protein